MSVNDKPEIKTVNPLGHPFPHAKLTNVKLTRISRLYRNADALAGCFVEDQNTLLMKEAA
jgi:hypothetical protein